MKKLILILIACISFSAVYAQKSKVVATYNYLRHQEYKKAKLSIDKAIVHPKTMNSAKTWWYNGQTYHKIVEMCMYNNDQAYCTLAPNAADIALDSYIKALVLNFTDEKWHSLDIVNKEADAQVFGKLLQDKKNVDNYEITGDVLMTRFPALANIFVNKGVKELNVGNIESSKDAFESFEKSLFLSGLMKVDTLIYYYTAIAASRAEMYDESINYFKKVIEFDKFNFGEGDTTRVTIINGLSAVYLSNADTAKYIRTLKDGIEKYPNLTDHLVTKLINYYLDNNMSEEALNYLSIAIERTPNNHTYYLAQGSLFDKLEKFNEAEASYKKAIEIKPDFFDANYNLGAIYYNKGGVLFNSLSDIPINKQKLYDKTLLQAQEQFKIAKTYLEKAHEVNETDFDTMTSLVEVYVRLKMYDKSKEMKANIEGLK